MLKNRWIDDRCVHRCFEKNNNNNSPSIHGLSFDTWLPETLWETMLLSQRRGVLNVPFNPFNGQLASMIQVYKSIWKLICPDSDPGPLPKWSVNGNSPKCNLLRRWSSPEAMLRKGFARGTVRGTVRWYWSSRAMAVNGRTPNAMVLGRSV